MATTNFVNGTVVQPEWLNDVDDITYRKARDTVSVTDFGALCDWNGTTGTDDTAAVQAAIDYCVANNVDLTVPRMCLITTVNIDRPVDGAAFDHFFTISGVNGGGFIRTTAGAMFSSRIPYNGVNAVSQLIRFSFLKFEGGSSALAIYVMDGARYLRSRWDDCSFRRVRLFTTATGEAQSLYLTRCQMRRWEDWFLDSSLVNFDVHIHNCLMEAGSRGIRLALPVGSSILQTNIEGMFYHAIEYTGGYGFKIGSCYFEYNGYGAGQDGASIVQTGGQSLGMSISDCYFSGSHTPNPQIIWKAATNASSRNNHCTTGGVLHVFDADSSVSIDNDSAITTLIKDQSVPFGVSDVGRVGKVWYTPENSQYGASLDTRFITGEGAVLRLRTINDNVAASHGIELDDMGRLTCHSPEISLEGSREPSSNGAITFEFVSNTTLRVALKGTDGIVRKVSLTLA